MLNFDKITETIFSELMIEDMAPHTDKSQYGNKKGISIQHYLIKFLHQIFLNLDKSQQEEAKAAIAVFIDWKDAFPRQCHELGIKSFIKNGVRPQLIPALINYFQNRQMFVKWHGKKSTVRNLPSGGPQGSSFGNLEYLSQSNEM